MFRDVFISLSVVTAACLTVVGLSTVIALVLAILGLVSVSQISDGVQTAVDYGNYLLSAYGAGSVLASARAALPHIMTQTKVWLASIVNGLVSKSLREQLGEQK